jgi:hypothetical protein
MSQHIKAHIVPVPKEPKIHVRAPRTHREHEIRKAKVRAVGALASLAALAAPPVEQRGGSDALQSLMAMIGGGRNAGRLGSDTLSDEASDPEIYGVGANEQQVLRDALEALQYLGEKYDWDATRIELIAALCADSATARREENSESKNEPFLSVDARNVLLQKLREQTEQRFGHGINWIGALSFSDADNKFLAGMQDNAEWYTEAMLRTARVVNTLVRRALTDDRQMIALGEAIRTAYETKLRNDGTEYADWLEYGKAAGVKLGQELVSGVPSTPWDGEAPAADVGAVDTDTIPPAPYGTAVGGPGTGEGFDEDDIMAGSAQERALEDLAEAGAIEESPVNFGGED